MIAKCLLFLSGTLYDGVTVCHVRHWVGAEWDHKWVAERSKYSRTIEYGKHMDGLPYDA